MEAGLGDRAEIVDGRPPAYLSEGACAVYVGNFAVFGAGPERPAALLDPARKAPGGAGLPRRATEGPATFSELLGWVFDGNSEL